MNDNPLSSFYPAFTASVLHERSVDQQVNKTRAENAAIVRWLDALKDEAEKAIKVPATYMSFTYQQVDKLLVSHQTVDGIKVSRTDSDLMRRLVWELERRGFIVYYNPCPAGSSMPSLTVRW